MHATYRASLSGQRARQVRDPWIVLHHCPSECLLRSPHHYAVCRIVYMTRCGTVTHGYIYPSATHLYTLPFPLIESFLTFRILKSASLLLILSETVNAVLILVVSLWSTAA